MPSVADRITLLYDQETVFGVTDSGPPTFKTLRITGESLQQNTEVRNSTEIRNDRQLSRIKRVDLSASGDINFLLSYGAFDDFLEAALFSAVWTTSPATTGSISLDAVAADNSFNRTTGDFTTDGFVANQWIKSSGFATAGNNGFWKIVSVAATKIIVTGGTLTNDSAAASRTLLQGAEITNGTTLRSYAIERQYTDLTNIFSIFNGMVPNVLSLNIAAGELTTGTLSFVGKSETSAAATVGDGSPTLAPANDIQSGVDDINKILENNAVSNAVSISMSLNNNVRARTQIGTLGAVSVVGGTVDITGTLRYYFENHTLFDKFLNQTTSSIGIVIKDSAGNAYAIDLPRVRYSSGNRVAGGQNTDIIADLAFSAFMHETELKTIRIARWAA